MSKNPYPRHLNDFPDDKRAEETENVPHAHGGLASLPDQQYDDADEASEFGGKGWKPDYSGL